jgi:hypothetical protein
LKLTKPRSGTALCGAVLFLAAMAPGVAPAAAEANLVANPGFNQVKSSKPVCWTPFASGTTTGKVGVTKGIAKVTISKWRAGGSRAIVQAPNCAIKAVGGQSFDLSVTYKASSKKAAIWLFLRDGRGIWKSWTKLPALAKTSSAKRIKVRTPALPAGSTAFRWAVTLNGKGTLRTDNYVAYRGPDAGQGACTDPVGCAKGRWAVVNGQAPLRAIHSVLLRNGKVLLIAGSGSSAANFEAGDFRTYVYDPVRNTWTKVKTPTDLFCAGHVQLPDGKVLVMGGTVKYPKYAADGSMISNFVGLDKSYIFDPADNSYHKLTSGPIDGHWYPSATELGNGDVFSAGGFAKDQTDGLISKYVERFSFKKGRWLKKSEVKNLTNFRWATYPTLVLMQDGRLFYTGASSFPDGVYKYGKNGEWINTGPGVYNDHNNTKSPTFTTIGGLRQPQNREYSTSVLLPPAQQQRVLTIGGGHTAPDRVAHGLADIIDLRKADPKYRPVKGNRVPLGMVDMDMPDGGAPPQGETGNEGKFYVSAVILPDGKVLETGGALHLKADPVYEASLFDPKTERFTPVAADPVDRMYHNTAILLPDGRVLAAGSERLDGTFNQGLSIYSPPYLFKGPRPKVKVANPKKGWAYGSTHKIKVSQVVGRASLIRPAAVTHQSDPNQRSVALPFRTVKGVTSVKLTANRNLAPPGWYMLFVTNKSGVPSVAQWVHIG